MAGLEVTHRALAQFGARYQLFLAIGRPDAARLAGVHRMSHPAGAGQLLHLFSLVAADLAGDCYLARRGSPVSITGGSSLATAARPAIEVVRRRLGHASTETTQVYTLLADKVADAEIRAARRRRDQAAR
jgi:integrase